MIEKGIVMMKAFLIACKILFCCTQPEALSNGSWNFSTLKAKICYPFDKLFFRKRFLTLLIIARISQM